VNALPRVSVVIPCFNYARYLPAALGSVLAQDGVDVDVVVVDDASGDDSLEVAREFADRDPRVRVIAHSENRGHLATANDAVGQATGEFVVKLDADDLLTPGSLARAAGLLRAYPGVAFCYGWAEEFTGDPPVVLDPPRTRTQVWSGEEWTRRVLRRGHNVIRQPEVMMRRAGLEAVGGYDVRLPWAEDLHLWLRLAAHGDVGRLAGPTQGLYRVHDKSLMRAADDLELTDLRWRIAAIDLYLTEHPGAVGEVTSLRALGLSSLAREARALAARGATGHAEARALADELDARSGVRPIRSLSAHPGPLGDVYRDLSARLRWRRWRRIGV